MSEPTPTYNGALSPLPIDEVNIIATIREAPDELLITELQLRGYTITKK